MAFPPPPAPTTGSHPPPPPAPRSWAWRRRAANLKKVRPWHIGRFFKNPARPLWVKVVTVVLTLLVLFLASIPGSQWLYRNSGRPWGWDLVGSFWIDVLGAPARLVYWPWQTHGFQGWPFVHSPGVADWLHLPLRIGAVFVLLVAIVFIWRINGRLWTRLGLLLLTAAICMAGVTHDWVSTTGPYQEFSSSTKIVVREGTLPDGKTYKVEDYAPPTADGLKKSAAVLLARYNAGPKAEGYDPQGLAKYCRIYDTLADIDETVTRESQARRCPEFKETTAAQAATDRSPTEYALAA